ncbi:hypothetical protein MID00_19790 [Alcaligenes sp. NLF5-7]|uniref:hypothetical protein n=1 Tax=Alcaligenes sp. NLF5-7 TaxID=2918755 RepID=UPI0020C41E89|nr:hypothetical protein [Alcaligenes sp. NLF5-7]UTM01698.1 hypothetical protein MID00_19790 [Alcaligenes sp. NLF5-7]
MTEHQPCDFMFLEWWKHRIIERLPLLERPELWLHMHINISMRRQELEDDI